MAPRRNRSAVAVEPALDNAPVPMEEAAESPPVDVSRKARTKKTSPSVAAVAPVLPPEAEKENAVTAVPASKRGGKGVKTSASVEAAQPMNEDGHAPEVEQGQEVKPAKKASKKKPLQESNAVTENEMDDMTKNLQDIKLGKAQLKEREARQQEKEAQLQAKEAKLNQEVAALQLQREEHKKKLEEQKRKDEKLRKLQKVEKDDGKPRRKIKDPEEPKKNTTAYFVFCAERRASLVAESEPKLSFPEIAKRLGEEWKKLTDAQKVPYEKIANDDKLRYAAEKEAFLKKKALEAPSAESDEEGDEVGPSQTLKKEKSPKGEVSMKRKVKIQMKDPNKPKKAPSAWDVFRKEMQQQVKEQNPEASFGERSAILGKLWQEVSEDGKREYNLKALPAQEKYKEEMSQYRATQM